MRSSAVSDINIYKTFAKYVSCNAFGMIGFSCYILADTLFVANGLGKNGLTALNLVLPIYSFISAIGLLLGMGGATRYSIWKAAKEAEAANRFFTQAMLTGLFIGLLLTTVGVLFSYNIVKFLGADATILPLAGQYLKTILLFSAAFIINHILVCFIRNDHDPNLAMTAMLVGSFGTVVLDYIFIFPCQMGMFGAALALGLAPIISMLVLSKHFLTKKNQFHLVKGLSPIRYTTGIFSLGAASFITEFSSGIIILLFNFAILGLVGNTGVAAYGIIANLALMVASVFTGVAQGIQPMISHYYGAGNLGPIKKVYSCAIILSVALGICFYAAGLLFPDAIISLFNGKQDPLLAEMAKDGIKIYFSAFLIMGINIVSTSFFAAVAQSVQSFTISLLRGCLAIIPLIFILPRHMGMLGVWLTIPCAEVITLLIALISFQRYHEGIRRKVS